MDAHESYEQAGTSRVPIDPVLFEILAKLSPGQLLEGQNEGGTKPAPTRQPQSNQPPKAQVESEKEITVMEAKGEVMKRVAQVDTASLQVI